jgi:preprotein translocase subunit SecF
MRKMRKMEVADIIDSAITATMSRTIITHSMTQLMVLAMFFFGGEALHNFALALTIGIIFGIYSSVLVACPVALALGVSRADLLLPEREGAIDNRP